jgi:hypothetical protein
VCDTIEEVVEDLSDYEDTASEDHGEPEADVPIIPPQCLTGAWRVDHPVLCVASRSPLDQAASIMLAQLLAKHGLPARVQPYAAVSSARSVKIDAPDAPLVCLSYFGSASNPAHVRFLIRRLRRIMPDARFLAGFWMLLDQDEKAEEWRAAVGAHLITLASLADLRGVSLGAHGPDQFVLDEWRVCRRRSARTPSRRSRRILSSP